jgi:tetratricopeptide (TPR) repeat protein
MNTMTDDRLARAIECVRGGNFEQAGILCDAVLRETPDRVDALKILSGVRFMEGRLDEALSAIGRAAVLAPGDARVQANLGSVQTRLGRFDEAIASFEKALTIEPGYAEAHYNLGSALSALERHEEALGHYDHVLAAVPNHHRALINRGASLTALNRHEEAIASYDKVLASDPGNAEAQTNRGAALNDLHRVDEAIGEYDKVIANRPHDAFAHWNKALASLYRGDLATGWREHEWRWAKPDFAPNRRDYPQPQWRGETDPAGKTILVFSEQGLGDSIQFCRYATLLAEAGATVLVEIQPALKSLLSRLPGAAQVIARGEALPAFDLQCPLMSLPLAFSTTLESIPAKVPYLSPLPAKTDEWRRRLGARTRPRIGIAWSGSPTHKNDRNRSLPLARLAPLASDPRFEFHVLQKDIQERDRAALEALPDLKIHSDKLIDFDDTAALTTEMDLVVSVDTAAAHLAGAMARPTWVMLTFAPDWRWMMTREDSPWYPTMRLFRQTSHGDWDGVLTRVREALNQRFA